jgi:succinoglycan biosynthesis transport protein ExoP
MAITTVTPRDRLQRIVDLARKAMRYWWLIGVLAVVGGGLSLAFAMLKGRQYQSWATVFYQERIQSSLLSPNREDMVQRNIGDKYRELLLSRAQLGQIVEDPKLNPFPNEPDHDQAIDALRGLVKLEGRGGNAFRVAYTDADPDRAKAIVERLTKMLQEKDEELRNKQARETVEFATKQKEDAEIDLKKSRQELSQFLAEHQEFTNDSGNGQTEGAGIRARANQKETKPLTPEAQKLLDYERQRQRILARLNAPADAPPVRVVAPPSPERTAALAALADADRELAAARREAEGAEAKYGPRHPTVINAQKRLETALEAQRRARAGVPPEEEIVTAPATPQDRSKLQRALDEIDQQVARLRDAKPGGATPATDTTSWIVELETRHGDLRRRVAEQSERVSSLAQSVFRSELDARQKLAEAGGRLALIDPAFKPGQPAGPGKKIFLMAGLVLFMSMGVTIAVVLAVIDDRLYRRGDLEQLGITVLGVIPPAPKPAKASRARAPKALPPPAEKDAA